MNAHQKLEEVKQTLLRMMRLLPMDNKYGSMITGLHGNISRFLRSEQQNAELAEEFSQPGTLMNFLLKRGFMPGNEKEAEMILDRIIDKNKQ